MFGPLKGLFGGSGQDLFRRVEVCEQILRLTNKQPKQVTVVYLGTATYDSESARENQIGG